MYGAILGDMIGAPFLLAFRLLCRTYYPKYKDMVTEYVEIYKELFELFDESP